MYRTDHLAFRTLDREKCVKFFIDALGYKYQETFLVKFDDEGKDVATCTVLEPSNRIANNLPWTIQHPWNGLSQEYVLSYELFISEGTPGSIVHTWASKFQAATGLKGGLHHVALQVPEGSTIEAEMKKWQDEGWVENGFSTPQPIVCPELKQCFTRPSMYTGVVYELLERKEVGFCRSSVRDLMLATKGD